MKHETLVRPTFAVALALVFGFNALRAADPFSEGVRSTEPLTPEQEQKSFHLPPGFTIQLVATEPDLRKPMNMAFDGAGRLWLTESREYPFPAKSDAEARDTIRIFSEFAANGRAGKVTTFATNLNIPIGIYPFRSASAPGATPTWKCIAWSIPNIWLFEDTNGDGVADKKEMLYGPFDFSRDTHGNQASFRRGDDGWIYATHGFNNQSRVKGRDGHEIFLPSGNIYRFRLDGSRLEHWTHGQVNPFGLYFDPLGNLYSADCHSSPIYQLLRGGSYPSFGRPHNGLGYAPVTIQHSHGSTAIAGIVHISDRSWPAEFQDNIFIGNVMTSRINRDRLEWRGATSVGKELPDFLRTDDPWFRPVDLQFGPDGALWVADFYNRIIGHYEVPLTHPRRDRERGRLWRIVPPGGADIAKLKVVTEAKADLLLNDLISGNPTRRSLALNELAARPATSDEQALVKQAATGMWHFRQGDERPGLMSGAAWLLERRGALDEATLLGALADRDVGVQVQALRILTDRGLRTAAAAEASDADPAKKTAGSSVSAALRGAAIAALKSPAAMVQRTAADALGANPALENLVPLLQLQAKVPAEDTHLAYVVRLALREQLRLPMAFARVGDSLGAEESRAFANIAVGVTNADAAAFLLRHVQAHAEPRETLVRYAQHVARYSGEGTGAGGAVALVALARGKFGGDLDTQAALFKALQESAGQRGDALGETVKQWGGELARGLLEGAVEVSPWTNFPVEGAKESRNPWAFQERACADGKKVQLMSSLPLGETLTGALRSQAFPLPKTLSFFLCGHDALPGERAAGRNAVRLIDAATKQVLRTVAVPRNDTAQKITWDLAEFAGKSAYIEAVDGNEGKSYAWLAFGRFEPALPQLALVDPQQAGMRPALGAELARSLKLAALHPVVAKLFNTATDVTTRAAAGRAWISLNAIAAVPAVEGIVRDAAQQELLRAELAAQLGESTESRQLQVVVAALTNAPSRLQAKFASALATTAAGTEQLLAATEAGRVPARILQNKALADRLGASGASEAKERLAALTKNLPPADAAVQKLIDATRAAFNPTKARTERGAAVFVKNCAVCHQLGGQGALIGPQLDGIGGRGLERIVEDVLDPNRNVDKAFRSTLFIMKDGEVNSGLFRREEGETVVVADSTGKEMRFPKAQVKERRESETSLMPGNLAEIVSPAELQDLLAYLLGQTAVK